MSGLVFVGGGTGSTFLVGAFITGAFAMDFAVDFAGTVLASSSFTFFVTLEAETVFAVGIGFVGDLDATVLSGAAMVLPGCCLPDCCLPVIGLLASDLLGCGAAIDFGAFLSPFVPAIAFTDATLEAIAFDALVAFGFDELESSDFFDSDTEYLFFVALGLTGVDLVTFATLAGIFGALSFAFLLGFAAGNLAAAFELADFLRAVGKVKLLAV